MIEPIEAPYVELSCTRAAFVALTDDAARLMIMTINGLTADGAQLDHSSVRAIYRDALLVAIRSRNATCSYHAESVAAVKAAREAMAAMEAAAAPSPPVRH